MHYVRQEDLPFVGSSHEFVGAEQGDAGVSVFLFHGKPGSGPGPHRHPYDEIQFIREGRGVWTVNGKTFEGSAGDIFVIKAGEIHSFKAVGDSPLVQLDIHLSPRFIQENCKRSRTLRCFWHGADGHRLKGLVFPSSTDHVIKTATQSAQPFLDLITRDRAVSEQQPTSHRRVDRQPR